MNHVFTYQGIVLEQNGLHAKSMVRLPLSEKVNVSMLKGFYSQSNYQLVVVRRQLSSNLNCMYQLVLNTEGVVTDIALEASWCCPFKDIDHRDKFYVHDDVIFVRNPLKAESPSLCS